jgi:hypothetical protein
VFPVQTAPNKRPLTERGFHDATTDHAQIVAWWTQWPAAQVGVDCGRSRVVTVDLDRKADADGLIEVDGYLSWDLLEIDHGNAGCALAMQTPRGPGKQLFFGDPDHVCRRRLGVRPGIDLLGDGGYTIVPSPASPGRQWLYGDPFEVEDLTPAPAWIVELAGSPAPEPRSQSSQLPSANRHTPLTDDQVRDIRAALSYIPNHGRDEWLRVGFALKASSAGEQAYDLWCEWSRSTPTGAIHPKYNEKDQRYTWEHAAELRADGREVTLLTLFWMAMDRGYQGPVPDDDSIEIKLHDATSGESSTVPPAPAPEHQITLLDWTDVAELPPVDWMVEGLIPSQSLTVLAGDTEAGKTFEAIDLALRLVHNLPWCGQQVKPCSVLYLAGEGQHGLAARFRAWRQYHQHLGLDAGGRYCVLSSEIPLLAKRSMHTMSRLVDAVVAAKGHAPGLIVIDTLSQGLEDDENEAKVVAPVLRGLMALTKRYQSSVVVVHHLVKLNAKLAKGQAPYKPTRDSVRGSSALTRNVDTVLGLIVTDDAGGRELHVWKQKDGEKLQPIKLLLTPTWTGRIRSNTFEERSCVMALAPDVPLLDEQQEKEGDEESDPLVNSKALELLEKTLVRIEATLRKLGAVEGTKNKGAVTSNAIVNSVGRKKLTVLAALEFGLREGRLRNVGTKSRASWLATDGLAQTDASAMVNE